MEDGQNNLPKRLHILFETVKGVAVGSIVAVSGALTGTVLVKSIFAGTLKLPDVDNALKEELALFGTVGALVGGVLRFQDARICSRETGRHR